MEPWKVTLTDTALADLDTILEDTLYQFGSIQLTRYTVKICGGAISFKMEAAFIAAYVGQLPLK